MKPSSSVKRKGRPIMVFCDDALLDALKDRADLERTSRAALIRRAIVRELGLLDGDVPTTLPSPPVETDSPVSSAAL